MRLDFVMPRGDEDRQVDPLLRQDLLGWYTAIFARGRALEVDPKVDPGRVVPWSWGDEVDEEGEDPPLAIVPGAGRWLLRWLADRAIEEGNATEVRRMLGGQGHDTDSLGDRDPAFELERLLS